MKMKKVIDEQVGILDFVPASKGLDVISMIEGYEQEGREILKANGYPLTLREMVYSRFDENKNPLGEKVLPRRVKDVMNMMGYFQAVRFYINKNVVFDALCFMAYGVQAAMKARIRPVEPLIEIGANHSQTQSKKGSTPRHITRNKEIIEKFKKSPLKISSFSQKYSEKYGLKPRQIRNILKKAFGNIPG